MNRWLAAAVRDASSLVGGVAVRRPSLAPAPAQEKPLTKVIFSLDFIPLGRHAPWYAALAQGYFKEEGLDVSIIPSQGTAQTIQAVESGIANIAFVDVPSVVLARANGSKLRMVAVNYQKAPYAIFSLGNGANVTQPKQLEGLTLGSGAGSFTPKVIEGFMAQKGLDPSKLKITNVAPPARASMLLSGQVPAIEFFVMAKPGLEARRQGRQDRAAHLPAQRSRARTLFQRHRRDRGLSRQERRRGEALRARRAQGMEVRARQSAKGRATSRSSRSPSLKPEIIVAEIGIVGDLAVTADVKQHGFGWFDPAKMKSAVEFVAKYVGMTGTPPAAADVYATGFLPSPGDHALSIASATGAMQQPRADTAGTVAVAAVPGAFGHFRDVRQEFPRADQDPLVAIAAVSFDLEAGTLVTLLGPSGCGKTTFLQDRRRPHPRHQRRRADQRRRRDRAAAGFRHRFSAEQPDALAHGAQERAVSDGNPP